MKESKEEYYLTVILVPKREVSASNRLQAINILALTVVTYIFVSYAGK